MQWLAKQQMHCFGQSSWGPTGFAILENEDQARECLLMLQTRFPELAFLLCKGRNKGGLLCDISSRKSKKS